MDDNKAAFIWNTQKPTDFVSVQGEIYPNHFCSRYISSSFSYDGKQVVAIDEQGPNIWDVETGKKLVNLRENGEIIASVKFSPDGKRILTSDSNSITRLWDAQTGKILTRLQDHTHIVFDAEFSPNSRYILTITGGPEITNLDTIARIWDAQTGIQLIKLQGISHSLNNGDIFSPDNSRVLTLDEQQGSANIWDIQTGQHIAMLTEGFSSHFDRVKYSSDGKYIDALIISRDIVTQNPTSYIKKWPLSTVFHHAIAGENPSTNVSDPKRYLENLLSRGCQWLENYLSAYPLESIENSKCSMTPWQTVSSYSKKLLPGE